MGQMIYLKDVVTLALDEKKCVGCSMCVVVCPHAVLRMKNGSAWVENRDACIECGACARNCPTDALTVQAGAGCAAALINAALRRESSACCCPAEQGETSGASSCTPEKPKRTGCC